MESLIALLALVVAIVAILRVRALKQELHVLRELVKIIGDSSTAGKAPAGVSPPPIVSRVAAPGAAAPVHEEPPPLPAEPAAPPPIPVRSPGIPSPPAGPGPVTRLEAVTPPPVPIPSAPEAPAEPPGPVSVPPEARPSGGDIGALEAAIGGSWLNRIGVGLLVIGITFALGYSLAILGPAGKAALATVVSLLLIIGGVLLERREPFKFYGRGLIGGGWAALYVTGYAVHELQATRIVEDPRVGFTLLLLVGLGMIGHSLRYANQGLTAIAYGLAYAAIVLHSISAFTLAAATLLGLGTILHLTRRKWYGVAFGGMAATYGSLFLWYTRQAAMTPEVLRLGLGALAIDWVVFLIADFSADPTDEMDRIKAQSVALLNALAACQLAYLAWTRVAPGEGWQPLLALGGAYVVTSIALRRLRRFAVHPVHSLVATLFLGIAARRGLGRDGGTWTWLVEAQALVVLGAWLKDRFHRILGCIVFIAPTVVIAFVQINSRALRTDGGLDSRQLLLTAFACLCFYFTRSRLAAFAAGDSWGTREEAIRTAFSYTAFFLILLALWVQIPGIWVGPAAAGLMILLFEISAARRDVNLRVQAHLAGAYAALMAGVLSAPSKASLWGSPARVPAVLAVAAACFFLFLRQGRRRAPVVDLDTALRPAYSWMGTVLAALIVWLQARPSAVGPAWMILALLLVEVGIALSEPHLRRPGYVMLVAAHVSLAMSNLTATDRVFGWSVRAATLVPAIAATYYLWWRLRSLSSGEDKGRAAAVDETYGRVLSYLGAAQVALFARFEFGLEGAALRWSLAMIILLAAGYLLRDADFRLQAYALAGAVFVRAVGYDFRTGGPILGMNGPLLIALVGVACFIGSGALVRRRRVPLAAAPGGERRTLALESRLASIGQDLMWLLAVALAAIYLYRTRSGLLLIVAWALEGLVVTASGFSFRSPALRLSGLALLALGLAMTLYHTFRHTDTVGRIVSFIVLGVVLLLVSFGYARYRKSIRRSS